MGYGLTIFDYDGVLIDSLQQVLSVSAEFCHLIGHEPAPTKETIRKLDVMTYPELARAAGLSSRRIDAFTRYVFDRFRSANAPVAFFPGIRSLLHQLSPQKTAIVSGNAKDVISAQLTAHGLAERIGFIYGALESGDKAKKIKFACLEAGVNPAMACMVGDAVSDMRCAKQAGVTAIAVTWGWQPKHILSKENPDYVVDTVSELSSLLVEVNR